MGESAYSFSLTTFSPSGKLVQIEYALNAVNAGATSLGIRATNGVVLATEKKLPSILVGCVARGWVVIRCSTRQHAVAWACRTVRRRLLASPWFQQRARQQLGVSIWLGRRA